MAFTFHGVPIDLIDLSVTTLFPSEEIRNGATKTTQHIKTKVLDFNTYAGAKIEPWTNHISVLAIGGSGGGGGGGGGTQNNFYNSYSAGASGGGGGSGGYISVEMVDVSSFHDKFIYISIGDAGNGGGGGNGQSTDKDTYSAPGSKGGDGGDTLVQIRYTDYPSMGFPVPVSVNIAKANGGKGGGLGVGCNYQDAVTRSEGGASGNGEVGTLTSGTTISGSYSGSVGFIRSDGENAFAINVNGNRDYNNIIGGEGGGTPYSNFDVNGVIQGGGIGGFTRVGNHQGGTGGNGNQGYVRIAFFGQYD